MVTSEAKVATVEATKTKATTKEVTRAVTATKIKEVTKTTTVKTEVTTKVTTTRTKGVTKETRTKAIMAKVATTRDILLTHKDITQPRISKLNNNNHSRQTQLTRMPC